MPKPTSNEEGFYKSSDIIGRALSFWRNRCVLPFIRGKVIDFACGDNRLVNTYGNGIGVDIVDYGADNSQVHDHLYDLPFSDKSFDTATVIASLNYFDKPLLTLKEAHRVLKNDGQLIVTMPNYTAIKMWDKIRPLGAHRLRYNEKKITQFLRSAGFKIVKKRSFMLFLNTLYVAEKV